MEELSGSFRSENGGKAHLLDCTQPLRRGNLAGHVNGMSASLPKSSAKEVGCANEPRHGSVSLRVSGMRLQRGGDSSLKWGE